MRDHMYVYIRTARLLSGDYRINSVSIEIQEDQDKSFVKHPQMIKRK